MQTVDGWTPLGDLVWPVTYRFKMVVPWGLYNMDLTLECPALANNVDATKGTIMPLWQTGIATAIGYLASYFKGSAYCWKVGMSAVAEGEYPSGMNGFLTTGPAHGVTYVMHTGYEDRWGRRRLIFPCVPRSYIDSNGSLTPHGAAESLDHAHGLVGGLTSASSDQHFQWYIVRPDAIKDPLTGFGAPGFRRVKWLRVCQYTVPVPDNGLEP